MINIPLGQVLPYFSVQALLDGVTYTLDIRWNVRAEVFFMDVYDETGQVLYLAGLPLVIGAAIGAKYTGRPFPGFFVMLDTASSGVDAAFDDLDVRVKLEYVEKADLAQIGQ